VVVLVVTLPCLDGRQVALPILFRLFRPKDPARPELDAERPSQPELARTLIDMILQRFPTRIVEIVCDGAYASKAWQGLPDRATVTTRMRANAAVYELPAVGRHPGQQGRTPLKGAKLGSLAQIAETVIFEQVTIIGPDGRERTAHTHEFICLWYKPFHTRPVKVILIRNPGRSEGFDVALASTDADVPATELISRYDSRWTIETCHQEAKAHGVGVKPTGTESGVDASWCESSAMLRAAHSQQSRQLKTCLSAPPGGRRSRRARGAAHRGATQRVEGVGVGLWTFG
jgi:hypothetical protein